MTQTVIGIFDNTSEAEEAVEALLDNGFTESNVDLSVNNAKMNLVAAIADNNNESGISKFFKNLFGNDDEGNRYTKAAERRSIVTVHTQTSEEAKRASELLDKYGAIDINDDEQGTAFESDTRNSQDYVNAEEGQTISVIEENLQVGKRDTETGGVRLKSRIVEKPVEDNLRLREEYVRVERKQVNRIATDTDLKNAENVNLELIEHAEVPVVSKEARVVEEISIGRDVKHREETVIDTIRKTEVDIEEIGRKRNSL